MLISVIIITLNEADNIKEVIQSVKSACQLSSGKHSALEIILSDGGSIDETVNIAKDLVDKVIKSPKGRYNQLNYGAKNANGEVLLFLHGDTLLPPHAILTLKHILKNPKILGGGFKKSWKWDSNIEVPAYIRVIRKLWEALGNWAAVLLKIIPGDNVIFIQKRIFNVLNGFSPLLICEDLDLIRRLKKFSHKNKSKIECVNATVKTSGRRIEKFGFLKVFPKWFLFYSLWWLNLSHSRINQKYKYLMKLII
ncbi:MAG: glycosyltransferase family 2 protein [Candidatus Odinarchaeota archaeon]